MTTQTFMEGLTSEEARRQLAKVGPNEIYKPAPIRFFDIFIEEIQEPMMILLLVTGVLYSIFGNLGDAITIFAVIILLVLSEVVTEFRAKKAIASLAEIAALKAIVKRDGRIQEVESLDVVPDDLLILTTGTKIAADARVERGIDLEVDESALTGESAAAEKKPGDELYAGTVVVSGEGQAEVFLTGTNTRLGKIAAQTKEIKIPRTPLQLAMKKLAGQLVYVALFFAIVIPFIGFLRGQDWKLMIMTGLALAFAVIPEELPIVITMVLGLGSFNLSKQNLLIKKLRATESLANTTVIVTDKTGTITEGKMKIASIYPENNPDVIYRAALCISEFAISPLDLEIVQRARETDSRPLPEIIRERVLGGGRKTKCMLRKDNGIYELCKSGAPEEIFASCHDVPQAARDELERQTHSGRRVIGVAFKQIATEAIHHDFAALEKDMDFVGLISFEDGPRSGVKETIARAQVAGIRTIMVTGDHPATAASIAGQSGIDAEKVLTEAELNRMSDSDLCVAVKDCSVFARTTPEQKYRIVKALQDNHEVVAVTGDGINDVLALKGADIGIGMGKRGTDVAKDTADIVLADDNYNTIAQGIFEGRALFDNLQKGMRYYLCIKLALILIFLVPVILNVPMPFSPIQIIILELFMDLAASAGFTAEPKEKNIYTRKPRDPQQPIFNNQVLIDLGIKSLVLFAVVTVIFLYTYYGTHDLATSQTLAFTAWIIGHIVMAYVSRSDTESVFSTGLFTNQIINLWALAAMAFLLVGIYVPYVNNLVHLTSVPFTSLLLVAVVVGIVVLLLEFKKFLVKSEPKQDESGDYRVPHK
ncbi:MAG TPA: cation-transporting P-type ATPase [Anaerolineales bacterium]